MSRKTPAHRPGDVFPDSGSRLPAVQRDALDADGQALYDGITGDARSLRGLRGPAGISLNSPQLYRRSRAHSQYLRFESGLDERLRELAILVTAREMDSHFEWHAHEAEGKRLGLEPAIIDIVRKNKRVRGADAKEAAIIALGREAFRKHRVRRSTFATALELFGAETLVNIVALMGEYAATALKLTVFDQQLPEGATSNLD
ncbi:MAG TPA: carboxymuconolactone decarboxylase family protein [Candidatus Lustribacter sp.]|nr:carboxymuconolactone decarboxylase family protein [Candidatus Lustribacter sp.]